MNSGFMTLVGWAVLIVACAWSYERCGCAGSDEPAPVAAVERAETPKLKLDLSSDFWQPLSDTPKTILVCTEAEAGDECCKTPEGDALPICPGEIL